jgi:hypothetical protein
VCCVLHNFARDRQHVIDDLLLHEVGVQLEVSPNEPIDADNLIRSVQVTSEWNNFREQLANDMVSEYLQRHVELELE